MTGSQAIQWKIEKRLDTWEAVQNQSLVEKTSRMCEQHLCTSYCDELEEHRAQNFHSLVLRGNLWTEVRWVTKREKRGMMKPRDACTKAGKPVLDLTWDEHPKAYTILDRILDTYLPDLHIWYLSTLHRTQLLRLRGAYQGAPGRLELT